MLGGLIVERISVLCRLHERIEPTRLPSWPRPSPTRGPRALPPTRSSVSAPDHLRALESEAVHVFREVAAELERPVLLFSGGKDSIVLLRLAEKAFRPGKFPFPVMHVDTGHNFPEVLEYIARRVGELGETLITAKVQDSIAAGRAREEWDASKPGTSRNRLQ